MCNAQECKKYLVQYAGIAAHSVRGRTHEANVILTITGHELLFISLDFMVQNDYGFGLHDEYTYQAVNTAQVASINSLLTRLLCVHLRMH